LFKKNTKKGFYLIIKLWFHFSNCGFLPDTIFFINSFFVSFDPLLEFTAAAPLYSQCLSHAKTIHEFNLRHTSHKKITHGSNFMYSYFLPILKVKDVFLIGIEFDVHPTDLGRNGIQLILTVQHLLQVSRIFPCIALQLDSH
jgi:hypothetical protein